VKFAKPLAGSVVTIELLVLVVFKPVCESEDCEELLRSEKSSSLTDWPTPHKIPSSEWRNSSQVNSQFDFVERDSRLSRSLRSARSFSL